MKRIGKQGLFLLLLVLVLTALVTGGIYSYHIFHENRFGEYYLFSPEPDPKSENSQYWNDFSATDDYEKAMDITNTYLVKYPYSLDAMLNKAYLLISFGEYEEGVLLNQKAIEIHGRNSTAYNNIGWAYVNMDLYELGIYYLELAIEANSGSATYYELNNLGDAYQGLGEYEKAIEYYLRGIEEFPERASQTPPYCYIGLADTYQLTGDENSALESYHKILELDPENYNAFSDAVTIYKERNEISRILDMGKVYFVKEPEYSYAYSSFASLLYELEQYTEAAEYYLLYAEHTEYPAYGYFQAAKSYAKAGNEELSKEYMELCLQYDLNYLNYLEDDDMWGWSDD